MNNWRSSRSLNVLIILALITVGISPACKFISGQSFIEICSDDGVKTIAVDADQTPIQQSDNHKYKSDKKCPFCLAFGKIKISKPSSVDIAVLSVEHRQVLKTVAHALAHDREFGSSSPRGPPPSIA